MTDAPDWLPPLITLNSCGGDWEKYLELVYARFQRDFLDEFNRHRLQFEGKRMSLRRQPLIRSKEASFWHLVSEGDKEEERLPDLRRCERISWARAIINNANDSAIKRWENQRHNETNICLWLESENYIVVLGKRNGYVLLLTAYLAKNYKRKKFYNEYQEFISAQNG